MNLTHNEIFETNGDFQKTIEVANIIDTILVITLVQKQINIYQINLHLRNCGFFLLHEDLEQIVNKLKILGLISFNETTKKKNSKFIKKVIMAFIISFSLILIFMLLFPIIYR